jgi:hypothetical protein
MGVFMIQLHVGQFVSHLYLEQQDALLTSKEAMLAFLREQFQQDEDAKRLLWSAGRAQARGERVLVDCTPEEREAAQAIVYAVSRLADRARQLQREQNAARGGARQPVQKMCVYSDASKAQGGKRLQSEWVTMGGVRFRVTSEDVYSPEVWKSAEALADQPFECLRDAITATNRAREHDFLVESEEETLETSDTAHFEASSRATGYAWVTVDGVNVGRTRCWSNLDPVPETDSGANPERFRLEQLLARVRTNGVRVVFGTLRNNLSAKFRSAKRLLMLEERASFRRKADALEEFARDVLAV